MRTLIILCHPYHKSYCHALYLAAIHSLEIAGHEVDRLHLDGELFDPVMRAADLSVYAQGASIDPLVQHYQMRILAAEQLVFIFPIWWETMPALLKGFIDKVFTKGFSYEAAPNRITPKLTHLRRAVVITTMNTPRWVYRLLYGDAIQRALVRGTLKKCGVQDVRWWALTPVSHAGDVQRKKWLEQVEGRLGLK